MHSEVRVNTVSKNLILGGCFLLGLSLVFADQLSTIAIITLAAITLFYFIQKKTNSYSFKAFQLLLLPLCILLIHSIGFITGDLNKATNEFVRLIPLILLPATFISIAQFYQDKKVEKAVFLGVLSGLLIFFVVCNVVIISTMISQSQPIEYLMRWRYLNFNFSKPFDAHPAYIGLFVTFTLVLLLFRDHIQAKLKIPIALLLLLLLVQLVARNALVISLIVMGVYGIRERSKILLTLLVAGLIGITVISFNHPKDFLFNKLFYVLKEDATIKQDNRFSRLEASIRVFERAPIFGVGPGYDDELRIQEYANIGDEVAFQKRYNAHNQYIEYLSTFGIVGVIIFLVTLVILGYLLYKRKQWLYLWLLIFFMIACITESLLVRSLGVKYFALLIALGFFTLQICSGQKIRSDTTIGAKDD